MRKKILITGVCYIHRLLQLRYNKETGENSRDYITDVHPDFDLNRVGFFNENISDRFLFTDFHGRYSDLNPNKSNLFELLKFYEDKCETMYTVSAMMIPKTDVVATSSKDFRKLSAFWYFLFDEEWNPIKVKNWGEQRDKAIFKLLRSFPSLKFILYQKSDLTWWHKNGLPSNRVMFWDIDWGMSKDDYEEIRQSLISKGINGGHRFPTEESYQHLCDMILKDHKLF
jgi:hypothetical protein